MDEARLIEKLLAVEALHAGATTKGERDAAENARRRILERLAELVAEGPAGRVPLLHDGHVVGRRGWRRPRLA